MKALHFGAGNIGRGFIAEVYNDNNIKTIFADVNDEIINFINELNEIPIIFAGGDIKEKTLEGISGINTKYDSSDDLFLEVDIVTTSVGANNLVYLAQNIANGIKARNEAGLTKPIDVVACENLIGGSQILKSYVLEKADEATKTYIEEYVGFPNAAIDRIVPVYHGDKPLSVMVEPFREWIIETKDKKSDLVLNDVIYVDNLEPFIERKLFTVNTGHASSAYLGLYYGYENLVAALNDEKVLNKLTNVLKETGSFLCVKYGFDEKEHLEYINTVIGRFRNEEIIDDLYRIARNPITKLSYNERFIKPLRELEELNLSYNNILELISYAFKFYYENDKESVELKKMFETMEVKDLVKKVTGLEGKLADEISSLL